jgi:crotonobetainyl-CoA:carnitine CoA-transferase CaiB-like acyl-CoA transferase
VGVPIVDLSSGLYAAIAMLAALAHRDQTGEGNYIDIAMLDVQVAMLSNQAMNYLISGNTPHRLGNAHPNIQPQDIFRCSDGLIALAVGNDGQFVKLCTVLESDELAMNTKFATNAERLRNLPELRQLIGEKLGTDTRQAWAAKFEAVGVPCGPINSIDEVFAEPQVEHRGMLINVPHPLSGTVPLVRSPIRYTNSDLTFDVPPPTMGQHTDDILASIGRDSDEVARLREARII